MSMDSGGGRAAAQSAVGAPAIAMMVAAFVGLLLSLAGLFTGEMARDAMVEFFSQMEGFPQESLDEMKSQEPSKVMPILFIILNSLIIFGALQLKGLKSKGLGLMAAILSMVNIGSCCCVLGLPFGIWAIVAMGKEEVKQAFAS